MLTRSGVLGFAAEQYVGLVATRCRAPMAISTTMREANFRSRHVARDRITRLKLGLPNFYCPSGSTETGAGATMTVHAAIEDKNGVKTELLRDGSATIIVPSASVMETDWLDLPTAIEIGDAFYVRFHIQCSSGIIFSPYGSGSVGDGNELSTTTLPDKVLSGAIAGGANTYRPLYIVGQTRKRSVCIFGDSMVVGVNETQTSAETNLDLGIVARWIGPNYAYSSLGLEGEAALNFISKSALRRLVIPYCSDVVFQHGYNDVFGSARSKAQVEADWIANWAYATDAGKRAWQTTLTPGPTASTDGWATAGNQTVNGTKNSVRVALNADLRAGALPGLAGYFEVSDVLENIRDDGRYITNGTAGTYTSDGIHGKGAAYTLLDAALRVAASVAIA